MTNTDAERVSDIVAKFREDTEAYKVLKAAGHCAAKALGIVIDAERGGKYAKRWIEGCKELVRK